MPLSQSQYSEYIHSEQWRIKRLDALRRAGFCCQLCRSRINLHVHHNTYSRLGEELPSDLVVLCQICHDTFHKKCDQRTIKKNNNACKAKCQSKPRKKITFEPRIPKKDVDFIFNLLMSENPPPDERISRVALCRKCDVVRVKNWIVSKAPKIVVMELAKRNMKVFELHHELNNAGNQVPKFVIQDLIDGKKTVELSEIKAVVKFLGLSVQL